jgi:hypothetical protein
MASLTALQYLPVPLLVLSSLKTVVLANEAMGRLLGIDFESTTLHDLSISEVLLEKSIGDLGVDILQNGSPILVSWEVRNNRGLESEVQLWINKSIELSGQCDRRLTHRQRS